MTETMRPVEVWAPSCPCGDCGGLLGIAVEDEDGEISHPTPVFLSRYHAERWITGWAKSKLGNKRARALAAKLVRKVDPEEMNSGDPIYCPEGHMHEWEEWYLACVSEMN